MDGIAVHHPLVKQWYIGLDSTILSLNLLPSLDIRTEFYFPMVIIVSYCVVKWVGSWLKMHRLVFQRIVLKQRPPFPIAYFFVYLFPMLAIGYFPLTSLDSVDMSLLVFGVLIMVMPVAADKELLLGDTNVWRQCGWYSWHIVPTPPLVDFLILPIQLEDRRDVHIFLKQISNTWSVEDQ